MINNMLNIWDLIIILSFMNVGWNQPLENMTRTIHFRHRAIILTCVVDSLVRLSYSQTPSQLLNAYCPFRWQSASGLPDT